MATTYSRQASQAYTPSTPSRRNDDRPAKRKEKRTDIWSNLLRQTRQAQARNRNNAVAHRQLIVCDGSPEDQQQFVNSLARPPSSQPPSRNRDQREQKSKGQLILSNRYAYGYGYLSLYSPPSNAPGGATFGQDAEEAAKLEVHTIPEPNASYEPVLRRLLAPSPAENDGQNEDEELNGTGQDMEQGREKRPAIAILLSWKEPWRFLSQLREWLQLIGRSVLPPSAPTDDILDVLKETGLGINLVVQNVEAQQALEREGWQEETFDYVCQVLRTVVLPLHPLSSLLFTSSTIPPQQPGSALTEGQKVIYHSLDLDLGTLSPRAAVGGSPTKKEELQPKHNVVDRMNIVVPPAWDSVGKIRLLSENFSPEDVLATWQEDLEQDLRPPPPKPQPDEAEAGSQTDKQANGGAERHQQQEEVFEIVASSPVEPEDLPLASAKERPSAVRTYESTIQDPQAHKRPKSPSIQVTTRNEQDFLREMKTELDNLIAKDKDRESDKDRSGLASITSKVVGTPSGESTGALHDLGDVSFNVGGVSYNTVSAEAAIERLKRPSQSDGSAAPSPGGGSRNITPRQPRREDREAATTPVFPTPGTGKSDFPSEDLEKYFASLAKKSGGDSRNATPSRGPH